MSNDNKTLADAQPGGRVRLGDQAERARFEAWLATQHDQGSEHVTATVSATDDRYQSPVTSSMWSAWQAANAAREGGRINGWRVIDGIRVYSAYAHASILDDQQYVRYEDYLAALSAQPSPGGQDALFAEELAELRRLVPSVNQKQALDAAIAALAARQPSKQPDSVALGEATEFCIEKGNRQPAGEPITVEAVAIVRRWSNGDRYIDWLTEGGIADLEVGDVLMVSDRAITDEDGSGEVYAAPPAQAVSNAIDMGYWGGPHIGLMLNKDWPEHSGRVYLGAPAQAVDLGELREMLVGWKNSDYPLSYEGQCAQRALDACVADLQGWLDSLAVGNG